MEQSATSSSTSSPTKRRALAPLDSNALAAPKNLFKPALGHSPVKMAIEGRKRLLDIEGSAPAAKKACLGRDEDASERSASPDASSVFDTSANDNSWATAATEHDAAAVPTTRAETLRLRLSLANYKVRTGQTTVPLSELQQRPLPRESPRVVRVQSPESASVSNQEEETETRSRRDSIDSQQTEIMEEEDEEQS
ncbi:hypothetical protein FOC4_g10010649 [Fusarium odoratissimum]|uniref:Uncharacterized protein n=3 Tax=Fusarium oxysporum species complex TaxID=171631 RepID=N1RF67_FUSC4|nr:hypothetical protein FOC4_g10010648 [Fusarium odoratissimum]EMT64162.1 hypothetical protein FOC4_g10010649 [Fusarium odoratissimum]ENH64196.1 hypothetical protein FOC1_g10013467 [Fusarium oxysporum f. sp. cubense race 1]